MRYSYNEFPSKEHGYSVFERMKQRDGRVVFDHVNQEVNQLGSDDSIYPTSQPW